MIDKAASPFFRLQSLGYAAAAPHGVLKAADMEELAAANCLIEDAAVEADALRVEAQRIYEAEMARGYAEGRQEIESERAALLLQDQQRVDSRLADLERDMGRLVYDCVRQIIEGFNDDALALEVARSALASMRSERRGQLYVATSVFTVTRDRMAEIIKDFPEIETIDVIEDPELDAPNVRLESKLGVVTFVLDDTLETLKRLLEHG